MTFALGMICILLATVALIAYLDSDTETHVAYLSFIGLISAMFLFGVSLEWDKERACDAKLQSITITK